MTGSRLVFILRDRLIFVFHQIVCLVFAVDLSPEEVHEKRNTEPLEASHKCHLDHHIEACLELLRNKLLYTHIRIYVCTFMQNV